MSEMSWPDRYRPDDLEGVALAPDLRRRFEGYLASGALPEHLILYGPPGFGKTTIVTIIADQLYRGRVMRVKAAETGNAEFIRARVVGGFMRAMLGGANLLIFEEASGLSPESQAALRVPLEDWSDLCKVVFLTNAVDKFDPAVWSRCTAIEVGRPPLDECARILGHVLEAEGITAVPADVLAFARGHFAADAEDDRRDMRTLLRAAQRAIETDGRLPALPEAERATSAEELWQSPAGAGAATDGAKLLDDLVAEFNRYLVLPEGGVEGLALWTVFTWAHEAFAISPILTLTSPTKRAGKSTAFEMLEQLVPEPLHPSNLTPAVVFRLRGLAEADQSTPSPTPKLPALCLLMDEADAWIKLDEDMRGILNSGHARRGAYVLRMMRGAVGRFSSWYPKAIALIDHASTPLPDTLRDRSIIVPMQRKRTGETRPKFPRQHLVPELVTLREAAARWAHEHFAALRELGGGALLSADELNDRAKDNWQSLMAITCVAGGAWKERARRASVILSEAASETEQLVELLADIRLVFDAEGTDAIRSVVLTAKLTALDGSQWTRFTPKQLSRMLGPLGIRPRQLWTEAGDRKQNKNGYERAHFEDTFTRYLS